LDEYAALRDEGHDTPRALTMMGLQNGPPASPQSLADQATWLYTSVVQRLGQDLFVQLENKPLIVVLACGTDKKSPIPITQFSLRYMGTQLQNTPDLGKKGFWSWMDGTDSPVPAIGPDGTPEALTVTPAWFAGGGWLGDAHGYRNGATFLATMLQALATQPQFLLVCQWNEFAGNPDGSASYVDTYNATFSNDMEPTSTTECGGYVHHDDERQLPVCDDGWGFFPLNLLTASLHSYADSLAPPPSPQNATTLIRLTSPIDAGSDNGFDFLPAMVAGEMIDVAWTTLGPASKFTVTIDGEVVATVTAGTAAVNATAVGLKAGRHTLKVVAEDGYTRFALARDNVDVPLAEPVQASDSLTFVYSQ